jgi:hypothetical protein
MIFLTLMNHANSENAKGNDFWRAMEPQARNENASQAQRANSDNPEKL